MKHLRHTITNELGLHARAAGLIVKQAAAFRCAVHLGTPAKMVDAKRIIGVMSLALKQGHEMEMTFEGDDEAAACTFFETFLRENL